MEAAQGHCRDEEADGAVVSENERILERFMAKVDKQENGCWLWTAATDRDGYGHFSFERRTAQAHRVAYELLVGPIPEGLTLDHLCRERRCVSPEHLEPVTIGVNTLRGEAFTARQARQTHCKRGHEFTSENTSPQVAGRGRRCRACAQDARRRRTLRERADRLTGAGADPLSQSVSGDPSSSLSPDERRLAPFEQLTVWEAA
jgi:hypothetical protein